MISEVNKRQLLGKGIVNCIFNKENSVNWNWRRKKFCHVKKIYITSQGPRKSTTDADMGMVISSLWADRQKIRKEEVSMAKCGCSHINLGN